MNSTPDPLLAINPSLVYPLETAKKFFGQQSAWLEARKKGLKHRIKYIGRRGFVSGADLIEFISEAGKTRDYSN